jgi:Mlc titration factor MtfA (ptsG expression regulator)
MRKIKKLTPEVIKQMIAEERHAIKKERALKKLQEQKTLLRKLRLLKKLKEQSKKSLNESKQILLMQKKLIKSIKGK